MQWEYRVRTYDGEINTERALADFGKEGWELVSVVSQFESFVVFLKRPKSK